MNIDIEQLGPVKKKINVVIPPEKVTEEIESIYRKLQQSVQIKGFRQGRIPKDILKRYYKEQVEGEAISRLIQVSYPEALKKLEVVPVSQPVVENGVLEEGKEFFYSASFEVKPEIELKEYFSLKVEKEKLTLSQKDVDDRLTMIRESHASLKEVEGERPVKIGDYLVVDVKGVCEGNPFEGGEVQDHLLEIGPDSYLPGLSEKLIGLRKGACEEIALTIPEGYARKDLAGKTVNLKVTVKELKQKVLPDLDDAFVKGLGDYQGVEDLKKKLEESLEKEHRQRIDASVRSDLVEQLIEKNPFDVPVSMVERQIEFMMAETQRTLLAQGSSLEKLGLPLEAMKENYRKDAEKQVKCSLLADTISHKEGITTNDEEVEKKLEDIARANNQDVEKVKSFYKKEDLWEGFKVRLLENKTLDFLLKKSTIVEVDKNGKQ